MKQSDKEKTDSRAAMQNKDFRQAINFAFDRHAYAAQTMVKMEQTVIDNFFIDNITEVLIANLDKVTWCKSCYARYGLLHLHHLLRCIKHDGSKGKVE